MDIEGVAGTEDILVAVVLVVRPALEDSLKHYLDTDWVVGEKERMKEGKERDIRARADCIRIVLDRVEILVVDQFELLVDMAVQPAQKMDTPVEAENKDAPRARQVLSGEFVAKFPPSLAHYHFPPNSMLVFRNPNLQQS